MTELPDDPLEEARALARALASMLAPDLALRVAARLAESNRALWIAGPLCVAIGLDDVTEYARQVRDRAAFEEIVARLADGDDAPRTASNDGADMNEISTNGSPLTLKDAREFLERCAKLGIPEATPLRAVVAFGGKVKKLTARQADSPGVTE